MKKLLTGAVILGGIAAAVAYKLKKDEQEKHLLELELDLLEDEISQGVEEANAQNNDEPLDEEGQPEEETRNTEETEAEEEIEAENESLTEMIEDTVEPAELGEKAFEDVVEVQEDLTHVQETEEVQESTEDNAEFPFLDEELKEQINDLNEHNFRKLQDAGDAVSEERPIQHLIEFRTQEDLLAFRQSVVEKGYVVTGGNSPLEINVLHIAPIDRIKLVSHVYYIANQALKHHGVYQGWKSRMTY